MAANELTVRNYLMRYRKAVIVITGCALLTVVGAAAFVYVSSRHISKEAAAKAYQHISVPAGLRPQGQKWFSSHDNSLPEEDTWQYAYTTSQSAASITKQLATAFQQAGISLDLVRPANCTAAILARHTEPDTCPLPHGAPATIVSGTNGRYAITARWIGPDEQHENHVEILWNY